MKKGFTLIELLVVIAIIGILSSVVLASLNTARSKGSDAAVKSNISNMRAEAELFYDTNGGAYNNSGTVGKDFCTDDSAWQKVKTSLTSAKVSCSDSATSTAMAGQLSDTTWFCVDNSGNATTTSTTGASNANTAGGSCR